MTFEKLYEEMETKLQNYAPGFQRKVHYGMRRFLDIKTEQDCEIKGAEWRRIIERSFEPTENKEKEEEKSLNDHHIAKYLLDEFKEKISHP